MSEWFQAWRLPYFGGGGHRSRVGAGTLVLCLLSLPGLVGVAGCGEDAVAWCRPGVCPPGTRCDAADGQCVAVAGANSQTGDLGGAVRIVAGIDGTIGVAVHDATAGAVWFEERSVAVPSQRVGDCVRVAGGTPHAGQFGRWLAAATDREGQPHLAFYDASAGVLAAASRVHGAWSVDVVDPDAEADVGRWVSLTVDDVFGRHLAYREEAGRRLRLLSIAPHGCRPEGLAPGEHAPVVVTSADMADAGMASDDFGEFPSIAVGGDHRLLVAFYDRDRGNLVLARCDGSRPTLQVLDGEDASGRDSGDVGAWASLAVSPAGEVGVAYFDRTRGQLKYAASDAGELRAVVVDDGNLCDGADAAVVGQGAALAMLSSDAPGGARARIAYVDATGRAVRVARRSPHGGWACETAAYVPEPPMQSPDEGSPDQLSGVGLGLDLMVRQDDTAIIGYGWWRLNAGVLYRGIEVGTSPLDEAAPGPEEARQ